ncbi:MAG: hypothetical protein WA418_04390 [Bradyrhizobium sp.]
MVTMPPNLPPTRRSGALGNLQTTTVWKGEPVILAVYDGVSMPQTPNGSMILGFQNTSPENNAGKLALTSGAGAPEFFVAPALSLQPQILTRNWQANNLNATNLSANSNTPIWIEAFSPGIGPAPTPLPIGQSVAVSQKETLQGVTNPNWMQLSFRFNSSQLAVFGIIGGPQDASGNNAYVVALNSPAGDTEKGTGKTPPPGYYATVGGNAYSFEFNWGGTVIFVAYFGSANVVTKMTVVEAPMVTLISL